MRFSLQFIRATLFRRASVGVCSCFFFRADGANPPDYSKEAAVIEKFAKDLTFAADGTWRCEQSAVIRLQSDAAVRQFGVLSFDYNSDNQSVEIMYVRVRKTDGAIVETPADNVQDVSSEITRIAPTYGDLREKQVPVKALSTGDILEYKVRFAQKKPEILGQFWYSQNFLTGGVVLEETLRITTPEGKYAKVVSPAVKPEIREEAGQKIYSWKTAQLDPTPNEGDTKKTPAVPGPSVQLTTFKNWDEVGRWYAQLQADRVTVTPAIQAKAAELVKGLGTDIDKQKAIYNYVSAKFRYISVSFGIGRYQPHSAAEVLANQYGDCKDKHTLFASLLKAAGIEAWPALIGVGKKLDPEIPSPAQFDHVITVIPKEQDYVWLDTTLEVAPYGLLQPALRGEQALVIPNNRPAVLMSTPADPPFSASEIVDAEGALAADGTLKAHFDVSAHGDDELLLRSAFHQVPAAQWQELVQTLVRSQGFAGTVSNLNVDNPENLTKPFHYSYDYLRTNYSDWPNRRITPPLFPIALPFSDSAEKPADPLVMGAPGELTYQATVHLPKDFSAEIPESTNIQADFAGYISTYTVTDGVLSAKRQLAIKKSKVPVSGWEAYLKFAKKVSSDQSQFIQLAASTGPMKAIVVQNDAEAEALVRQAVQSLQSRDLNAARDALAQAERLNPQQPYLWSTYSTLYFSENDQQRGLDAIKKEIRNHPNSVPAYRDLAQAQAYYGRREEAIETLRTLLKMSPDEVDAVSQLSSLLIASKQYKDVPDLVQKALGKAPDNQQLQLALAEALLRDGRKDEGVLATQKLVKNSADGDILNNAAWLLADTNTDLPLAKDCAEKSVSALENDSKQVTLPTLSNEDLRHVTDLAAAWDTLGWVYFQLDDTGRAEKYLNASWQLTQSGTVADHLGQLYAKQGRREAAIHAWGLALAANSGMEDTRERLRKLGASPYPDQPTLRRNVKASPAAAAASLALAEQLGKLRTTGLPELPKQEGSAEFFILFSAGKAEDVQFITGSDALKSASAALMKARYDLSFPDNGPEKIARRGILSCSTYTTPSCQFVLLLPSTTTK